MRFILVLTLSALLFGCAQVGVLTGGERDRIAPQPVLEKMEPANQSTNYSGNKIVVPFNEFITLNKPSENLIVVPPNIKPKTRIKGKSLIIEWEDTLSSNTTYAFYLNGLVRDITENNDSLMTFVFSTGNYVDSLTRSFQVIDAFTNSPAPGVIVGLYPKFSDTLRPLYFGKTDQSGFVTLNYMTAGQFQVATFLDKSRDLKAQANEKIGFANDITISAEDQDTVRMRIFDRESRAELRSLEFDGPSLELQLEPVATYPPLILKSMAFRSTLLSHSSTIMIH